MSNYLFRPMKYPLMNNENEIGYVIIDVDSEGKYLFDVDINPLVESNSVTWAFRDKNGNIILNNRNKRLHHRIIRNWLEERVFPPDRQNADEILSKLGLTEYDLVSILKRTHAKNRYDKFWINFYQNLNHPDTKEDKRRY